MSRDYFTPALAGNALIAIATACVVGVVAWHFFDPAIPGGGPAVQHVATREPEAPLAPEQPDYTQIADWHLFGTAAEEIADTTGGGEILALNAVAESTLQLTVTGTVATSDGDDARAIVREPNGSQREYQVGEILPGNVGLHAVEQNRIVIRRNGVLEAIALPKRHELQLDSSPGRTHRHGNNKAGRSDLATTENYFDND